MRAVIAERFARRVVVRRDISDSGAEVGGEESLGCKVVIAFLCILISYIFFIDPLTICLPWKEITR